MLLPMKTLPQPRVFCSRGARWGAAALASDITYDFNLTVGIGTVTGDVITDGTLGTLGSGDIVDWDITMRASAKYSHSDGSLERKQLQLFYRRQRPVRYGEPVVIQLQRHRRRLCVL